MKSIRKLALAMVMALVLASLAPLAFAEEGTGPSGSQEALDYAALEAAIESAEALESEDYYPATWKLLSDQLEASKALRDSTDAAQSDIDAAAARLTELQAEGTGGYLARKSAISNPAANGIYTATFIAYNASGYGTGVRALAEFDMTRQFDPQIAIFKDGDEQTLKLLYAGSIDMQAVFLNDNSEAFTKTATGEKRTITQRDGSTAEVDVYEFSIPIDDLSADNKLSFSYDTGIPRVGVMTSSVYLIAQGLAYVGPLEEANLEPDMLYTGPSVWFKENSTEASSMGRHLQPTVEVRFVNAAYDVRITASASSDAMIADMTQDGASLEVVSDEGVTPRQFRMVVDSIDEAIPVGVSVNAGPAGIMNHNVQLVIDPAALAKTDPTMDEESTYEVPIALYKEGTYFTEGQESSMAGGFFEDAAEVTFDGTTYTAKVTLPATDAVVFDSMTYGDNDTQAEAATNKDGSTTFTLKANTLSELLKVGFTYTPAGFDRSMTHHADLNFKTAHVKEKAPEPTVYTVTYTDGQGTELKTEEVEEGGAATAPADPTREGYTFDGWDATFDNIQSDLTVNAKWTKSSEPEPEPEPEPVVDPDKIWQRIAGKNAYGTMAAVAAEGWDKADTVVIATFDGYWDALAASSLAGKYDAPILLTSADALKPATADEIERLGAKTAIIVGGTAAVSDAVKDQIEALNLKTQRFAGSNAQKTAIEIAKETSADSDTCIIATSNGYWDALAASPYAFAKKAPIYLTDLQGNLKPETLQAIKAGGFTRAIITGGKGAIPEQAEADLKSAGGVKDVLRKAGKVAIDTSLDFAAFALDEGMSANYMGVATTGGFWDALTGGPLCGKRNGVLVLASEANQTATAFPAAHKADIEHAYVFGGTSAISKAVFDAFDATTRPAAAESTKAATPALTALQS